jgi:hypothetical protein
MTEQKKLRKKMDLYYFGFIIRVFFKCDVASLTTVAKLICSVLCSLPVLYFNYSTVFCYNILFCFHSFTSSAITSHFLCFFLLLLPDVPAIGLDGITPDIHM